MAATEQTVDSPDAVNITAGEKLARNTAKGNCTACHRIGTEPATRTATVGPTLADIKSKFPDHQVLVNAIADQGQRQPDTIMPPYRRNRILTESEIELIAQFLETL